MDIQLNLLNMPYSLDPKDKRCKGYGFLSFAKNIGKNISGKYSQNLLTVLKNLQQMQ